MSEPNEVNEVGEPRPTRQAPAPAAGSSVKPRPVAKERRGAGGERSLLRRWLPFVGGGIGAGKGKPIVEYLPDADEIERSPVPPLARLTLHVLLAAIFVFVTWATIAKVDLVVTARGHLVTPLPNVVVQPLETAVIQRVDVKIGQIVRKGEQLALLDATFANADQSQLKTTLASLETQIAGLQGELAGREPGGGVVANADLNAGAGISAGARGHPVAGPHAQAPTGAENQEGAGSHDISGSGTRDSSEGHGNARIDDESTVGNSRVANAGHKGDGQLQADLQSERRANFLAQQTRMRETAAKLRASLATNLEEQRETASRLSSLRQMEGMQEKMVAQKYAAPIQLLEAQQRSKDVARELSVAISREKEVRRELAAFEADQVAFRKGWRQKTMEDLLAITRSRDQVREQVQKADRRQQLLTLSAPIDGVVLDIAKLSPGSVVREAETFFTLVPLGVPLEAEVQIDAADVGNIKPGYLAQVKIDAFPFQSHGTLKAAVRTISQDSFHRDAAGRSEADAYYSSRISLTGADLRNMKPGSSLLPGMTLQAEISVGERSVMSYLAWPLTKGLNEAIREP